MKEDRKELVQTASKKDYSKLLDEVLKLSGMFADFAKEVEWRIVLIEKGLYRAGFRLCSKCREWKAVISIGKDGTCEDCLRRAVENKLPTANLFENDNKRPRLGDDSPVSDSNEGQQDT